MIHEDGTFGEFTAGVWRGTLTSGERNHRSSFTGVAGHASRLARHALPSVAARWAGMGDVVLWVVAVLAAVLLAIVLVMELLTQPW